MSWVKQNLAVLFILLLTLLLICLVLWVFDKRLERLHTKVKTTSFILPTRSPEPNGLVYSS